MISTSHYVSCDGKNPEDGEYCEADFVYDPIRPLFGFLDVINQLNHRGWRYVINKTDIKTYCPRQHMIEENDD